MSRSILTFAILTFAILALTCSVTGAVEPLHQRIDQLIEAKIDGESAPLSDDAEFFRRLTLDLTGRIPSSQKTREFLKDTSPDKRRAAIERLLEQPSYAERMANLFHVTLMERRGDNPEWDAFLRDCFEQNKPWDQIAREILKPNPEDETLRGAAYFYTRRLEKVGQNTTDYSGLTRDVGRLFLGVDLQCAECHDHLFIDDYKQHDFQGLFAVYKGVSIRSGKFPAVNEASMSTKLDFVSVFEEGKVSTGPRVPFGKEFEIPDPPEVDPAEKKKKPDPNQPPAFSALSLIANDLTSGDKELFRKNIANRLWFSMMGQGLVEPLDQFHSANPPSHPELLDLLADELASHNFDIKWMVRELALTKTWQRSSRMASADKLPPRNSYRLGLQRRLTADQLFASVLQATGNLDRLLERSKAFNAKKDSEKTDSENKDAETKDAAAEEPAVDEYKELQALFLTAFGSEPKEPAIDYAPAVKQALFLLNDSKVLDLLKPHSGNLIDRLAKMPNTSVADELYLSIFCRLPDEEERAMINEYLAETSAANDDNENKSKEQSAENSPRTTALSQLAWAMLTSMEFCVNH
jgi:hypothetical protein